MNRDDPWPLPEPPHDLRAYVIKARCDKLVAAIHQASFKGEMRVAVSDDELARLPEGYVEALRAQGFEIGTMETRYSETWVSWRDEREKAIDKEKQRQAKELAGDFFGPKAGQPYGKSICDTESDYD